MSDLIRVETQEGDHAERGWLKDDKRHGLWIVQSPQGFTLTIYDCGEVRSEQVIAANHAGPLPVEALFQNARKPSSARHALKRA